MRNTLQSIIHKKAFVFPTQTIYGKFNLELNETNRTTITIKDVPNDCIAIKVELFPAPSSFIIGENMCKRADYALISQSDFVIIYVELKDSIHAKNEHIMCQLKGAKCVIHYIDVLCRNFRDKKLFDLEERFVSFKSAHINKQQGSNHHN